MMKKYFTYLLFSVLLQNVFTQTTIIDSIFSGGMYRHYRLYVPAAYDAAEAVPVVLNLHGYSSDNFGQDLYANFRPIADTANFLILSPNGTINGDNARFWNCFTADGIGVDDVAFLSDLIDSISAQYTVDANRVYSTGMSNGGFMSHALACELGNKITAIASVTGSIDKSRFPACDPDHPTPVMQIHGTADFIVPYNGSFDFMPVDSVVKYWVQVNDCNEVAEFISVPDINVTDECTAEHYIYNDCAQNIQVELYKIIDGGHTWPGTALTFLGVTNLDINACIEIWHFFNRYSLDVLTGLNDESKEINHITIHPNPSGNYIQIRSENSLMIDKVIILDIDGRVVYYEEAINKNNPIISINALNSGMYFAQIFVGENQETLSFIRE